MDMKLSAAEASLQTGLRAWLAEHHDFAAVLRRVGDPAARDAGLWEGLVAGGWITRACPRRDGTGQSAIDAAIVAEEFGRALVVEPFLRSGYLAAALLVELVDGTDGDRMLGGIADGSARFAAALYEPDGRFAPERVATKATERDGGWVLDGRKAMVMDGADASRLLVSAREADGGIGLFLVEGEADGIGRAPFHTLDALAAADLTFAGTPAVRLATGPDVLAGIVAAIDRTITVLGAEALGAAAAAIDETAAYTGKRVQFGRTISSFQVVAHRLARMFVELEGLRGGLIEALANARGSRADRAQAAAGLKVLIAENGRYVVNQGVQLHGGNGTIHEYKVSHCFKRVFAAEILFGNGDYHLDRYARAMA